MKTRVPAILAPNCTISRYAEKRQRTAALQHAAALSEAPRPAVRFWSAAVLCRFSIAFQRSQAVVMLTCLLPFGVYGQGPTRAPVKASVEQEYPSLFELYKHLHRHPELSFAEEKTSARVAEELRKAGYEVTTSVGKHGVVALLRNGNGPTVLVRTDMDALPV